jgi:CheY-like chemotaxis protein
VTDGMLFEVQDTGIGIALEKQAHIFQGFEQADVQTHRLYGGTGLGLAICERLVRLQQGTIGVRSTPGQGACFWFLLPWHGMAAEAAQAVTDMARALPHQPLRVLLVDDNAVNLLVARMMLQKSLPKAEVVEANSGPTALTLLREQTFDVVLMDMVMPDMSGLDATRILRQDFPVPVCQLPVLALTASVNPLDHEQCLAAGMNDVLPKPLDATQIVAKIAKVLAVSKVSA